MATKRHYLLAIDGPLLRSQRKLLLRLLDAACRKTPYRFQDDQDREHLEGLASLLDQIADWAHDRLGIDCLLETIAENAEEKTDDPRCDCEQPGHFCSGVPGILAHVKNGHVAPNTDVERCDLCERYPSDEAARGKLRELGLLD
jgi:hypothetical protein